MEQKYKEEIERLQQEIESYEAEQDECLRAISVQHGETLQNVLKIIRISKNREDEEPDKDVSKLMNEISVIEKQLRKQIEISGIALSECCVRTLEKSKTKTVQQYRLAGHCCFLSFQLEFALTEVQDGEASMRRITELNIIADGAEFKDLCSFVSSVEETRSMFLFFRTLRSFSECCEQRSRTFKHFKEKYPDLVHLPEGCRSQFMVIQDPRLSGCTMDIVWSVNVSKEGVIKPKLELLLKMPEQAQELDSKKVMESAGQSFQSLLRVLGVEAAIESLIQALC